ncbi:hypothetical protein M8818_005910 [Zalaria obscura]|uniref:Uncharacterized protein n=1 Tax=Zalaria obscura TaxID=2024903 RepID=A0ACC3S6Z2_9PEZI
MDSECTAERTPAQAELSLLCSSSAIREIGQCRMSERQYAAGLVLGRQLRSKATVHANAKIRGPADASGLQVVTSPESATNERIDTSCISLQQTAARCDSRYTTCAQYLRLEEHCFIRNHHHTFPIAISPSLTLSPLFPDPDSPPSFVVLRDAAPSIALRTSKPRYGDARDWKGMNRITSAVSGSGGR